MTDELNTDVDAGAEDSNDDATPKTFTEDEVIQRIQSETDRRVTEALKKQERKFSQKLAEADKLRNMDESQRKDYEFEMKLSQFEEEKKEFTIAQNKLEAAKVLSNRQLPVSLVDYIVADDADTMMQNIQTFERIFKAAVNDAVSLKIASPTPKGSGAAQTGMSKEAFNKLSVQEQQAIFTTNPELYRAMVG